MNDDDDDGNDGEPEAGTGEADMHSSEFTIGNWPTSGTTGMSALLSPFDRSLLKLIMANDENRVSLSAVS